jgi:hypothetical protein
MTTSGANGLDTGAEAASTWYYVWLISDGSTMAGLLSTSAATPTMPGGYVYKTLVGASYNDATSNLRSIYQRGNRVYFLAPNATLSATSNTNFASANSALVDEVPPMAETLFGRIICNPNASTGNGSCVLSFDGVGTHCLARALLSAPSYVDYVIDNNHCDLPLMTAQTLWYKNTAGSLDLSFNVYGYTLP